MFNNKMKKILVILFSVGIFGCLMLLLPQIRQLIIELTERFILGRALENHARWHLFLLSFSLLMCGALALLLFDIFSFKICEKLIAKYISKIATEENTFLKWYDRQTAASKTGFYSATIIALLTHIIMYSNLILEWHLPGFTWYDSHFWSGRWFHHFANSLNFYYMNWVTGILQIVFLSLAVFLIVKSFNINNRLYAVLIAGVFVTFPTIAESNLYFHDAAPYYFGALLSILAFYLTKTFKLGWIPGIVFMVLSLAIYQSKISVAMMAGLIYLILYVAKEKPSFISLLKYSSRYLLLIIGGLIIYYLSAWFFRKLIGFHVEQWTHGGFRDMSTLSAILGNITRVYKEVFLYFFSDQYIISNPLLTIVYATLALIGVLLFIFLMKNDLGKSVMHLGIVALLIFLLPFAANFIRLVNTQNVRVLTMIAYAFAFFLILPIILLENFKFNTHRLNKIMVLSLVLIIGYNISFSNYIYLRGQVFTMHSIQLANRVAGKIEPLLPYSNNNQVFITGNLVANPIYPTVYQNTNIFHEYSSRADFFYNFGGTNNNALPNWDQDFFGNIIRYRVGIDLQHIPYHERREYLLDRAISNGMPVYPLDGSVAIIDGTVVAILNFFGRLDIEEIENNGFLAIAKHTGRATDLVFEYSWYLYRNSQRVKQIITDHARNEIQLELSDPGIYQIRVFIRLPDGRNIIDFFSADFEVSE